MIIVKRRYRQRMPLDDCRPWGLLNLGTRYITMYTGEKASSTLLCYHDTPAAAGAQKWATNPDAVASRICIRTPGRPRLKKIRGFCNATGLSFRGCIGDAHVIALRNQESVTARQSSKTKSCGLLRLKCNKSIRSRS